MGDTEICQERVKRLGLGCPYREGVRVTARESNINKIIKDPSDLGRLLVEGYLSTQARNNVIRVWFARQKYRLKETQKRGSKGILIRLEDSPEIPLERDRWVEKVEDLTAILAEILNLSPGQIRNILYEKKNRPP